MDTMQALTGHRSLLEFGGLGIKTRPGIGAIALGSELWVFVSTSVWAVSTFEFH